MIWDDTGNSWAYLIIVVTIGMWHCHAKKTSLCAELWIQGNPCHFCTPWSMGILTGRRRSWYINGVFFSWENHRTTNGGNRKRICTFTFTYIYTYIYIYIYIYIWIHPFFLLEWGTLTSSEIVTQLTGGTNGTDGYRKMIITDIHSDMLATYLLACLLAYLLPCLLTHSLTYLLIYIYTYSISPLGVPGWKP